ncbi:MAG: BlaI/MecI/CopY family transcriptional regulator [Anaeromyxobacteraceae bacterium]
MTKPTLGDQELNLLRHVAEAGPLTVGQAADGFGERNGLARSTVLTVMERLRQKGYLTRRRVEGVYQYRSVEGADALLRGVVGEFVERTLAGSVSPFVAWLAEAGEDVSKEDLDRLEALVRQLREKGEKP